MEYRAIILLIGLSFAVAELLAGHHRRRPDGRRQLVFDLVSSGAVGVVGVGWTAATGLAASPRRWTRYL